MRETEVVPWLKDFERGKVLEFHVNKDETLSSISEEEREFVWSWCSQRNLDDVFAVVALTYWIRAKAHVAVNFVVEGSSRAVYMVLCIHLSLKWLGYDEDHKCNFFSDIKEVWQDAKPYQHRGMEIDLLRSLNWEM
jgi:hypothetical protein